jgi:hypothetical protein
MTADCAIGLAGKLRPLQRVPKKFVHPLVAISLSILSCSLNDSIDSQPLMSV